MRSRDLKVVESLLKGKEPETRERIRTYLDKLGKTELEGLIAVKDFLAKNRVAIRALGQDPALTKKSCTSGYCSNIVCNLAACVSSSGCPGGACSHNGCSAAAGCHMSRIAGCSGAPTCGNAACSSNSGGGCGNAVCSYVSGSNRTAQGKKRK